jgi:dimethylhistidine N-methyltransferase
MDTLHRPAPRRPVFIQVDPPQGEDQVAEIVAGLTAAEPYISPKYFYDPLGSRLFEAICELPEYDLTRVERGILDANAQRIAEAVGPGCTLIDLGAGNCEKAERLFELLRPAQYVAVDISAEFLRARLECLQDRHPFLDVVGVGMDFSRTMRLPAEVRRERRLFFYPGSSIGNFLPDEAALFLGRIREQMGDDGMILLGVDLARNRAALEAAYDDALGVTSAFNLNVLNHINRIAGTDFDTRDWQHAAFFNARASRIEMHLEARSNVSVICSHFRREFRAGDRIHTENSWKPTPDDVETLFQTSTLRIADKLGDSDYRYCVCLASG